MADCSMLCAFALALLPLSSVAASAPNLATNAETRNLTRATGPTNAVSNTTCTPKCTRWISSTVATWVKFPLPTITAATVIELYDENSNWSSYTTIHESITSHYPVSTASDGRRIETISQWARIPRIPDSLTVTTVTYPTPYLDFGDGYYLEGQIPTTDATGSATCLNSNSSPDKSIAFIPWPTTKQTPLPQIDDDDPLGYNYKLTLELYANLDDVYPSEAALSICTTLPPPNSAGLLTPAKYLTVTISSRVPSGLTIPPLPQTAAALLPSGESVSLHAGWSLFGFSSGASSGPSDMLGVDRSNAGGPTTPIPGTRSGHTRDGSVTPTTNTEMNMGAAVMQGLQDYLRSSAGQHTTTTSVGSGSGGRDWNAIEPAQFTGGSVTFLARDASLYICAISSIDNNSYIVGSNGNCAYAE